MTKGISRGPRVDLTGQKLGRLKVLYFTPLVNKCWTCVCDCGTEVKVDSYSLIHGSTKSCGCLNRDPSIKPSYKHGMYKSTEYQAFSAMKERCLNPNHEYYSYYGGRGIKVCDEWLAEDGFMKFFQHIGAKPSPKLELDRINNNGNYEPGNVRWIDHSTQMINRRKDEAKPERSRVATKNYWSRLTLEERQAEVKKRKLTTKKEITNESHIEN